MLPSVTIPSLGRSALRGEMYWPQSVRPLRGAVHCFGAVPTRSVAKPGEGGKPGRPNLLRQCRQHIVKESRSAQAGCGY